MVEGPTIILLGNQKTKGFTQRIAQTARQIPGLLLAETTNCVQLRGAKQKAAPEKARRWYAA
ncbi:hypothetical protein SLIQ_24065 [Serratia liquefaciens FK01]|nr:hypothetical protein SLIQ_24065 [Serratia liquefaciens FK01]